MWTFWEKVLQSIATALILAFIYWLTAQAKRQYERNRETIIRIGQYVYLVGSDLWLAWGIVHSGWRIYRLRSAMDAMEISGLLDPTVLHWGVIFLYVALRLYIGSLLAQIFRRTEMFRAWRKATEGAKDESPLSTALKAQESFRVVTGGPTKVGIYVAVSTGLWLWVSVYLALLKR